MIESSGSYGLYAHVLICSDSNYSDNCVLFQERGAFSQLLDNYVLISPPLSFPHSYSCTLESKKSPLS